MALLALNYPEEIAWERVCVSLDMEDHDACDDHMPPRWASSMALYRYLPDVSQQPDPARRLVYYKLTCSFAPYQPYDQELDQVFDLWTNGIEASPEIPDFKATKAFAQQPIPAYGAMVQLAVSHGAWSDETKPEPQVRGPIYIADVQPKQRVMYETVSDTKEMASRTLESLNVQKGSGTTQSNEVWDIDRSQFGATAGTGSVGPGANVSAGVSSERGTKSVTQHDEKRMLTGDDSRERRETLSHTTQISQIYSLLQAYHVGTNRVLFLVSGRPHTVTPTDNPNGFVDAPRPLDGIQEFFFIVSQPVGEDFPCVGARLDTSHMRKSPRLDFNRDYPPFRAVVDVDAQPWPGGAFDRGTNPNSIYRSFSGGFAAKHVEISRVEVPVPSGAVIDYVETVQAPARAGSVVSDAFPGAAAASFTGTATAWWFPQQADLDEGSVDDIVRTVREESGEEVPAEQINVTDVVSAVYLVHFRSAVADTSTGDRWALLLTSRGMCCCADGQQYGPHIVLERQLTDVEELELLASTPEEAPSIPVSYANTIGRILRAETRSAFAQVQRPSTTRLDGQLLIRSLLEELTLEPTSRARMMRPAHSVLAENSWASNRLLRFEEQAGTAAPMTTWSLVNRAHEVLGVDAGSPTALRLQLGALGLLDLANVQEPSVTEAPIDPGATAPPG